jgi:hypothetical protein
MPVSFAITGPVSAALGVRTTMVAAGVLGGVVTLAGLFVPGVRDPDRGLGDMAATPEQMAEGSAQLAAVSAAQPVR